jgi:hypothetical protein
MIPFRTAIFCSLASDAADLCREHKRFDLGDERTNGHWGGVEPDILCSLPMAEHDLSLSAQSRDRFEWQREMMSVWFHTGTVDGIVSSPQGDRVVPAP